MSNALQRLTHEPWRIAAGVLVLTALWVGSGLLFPKARVRDQAAPAAVAQPAPEVQVERLSAQPVLRTVTLSGRTAPARTVELKAETTGRVVATGAARGARIDAGTLIVRLDDSDRSARLAQTRATLRQRELEYAGQSKLRPQGYISDAKLAESAAQLESARADLRRAEIDIARMTVRAPFPGALQDRVVEAGDYVSPGTKLATFVDERTLVVAASVAENQVVALRRGLKGKARLATGQEVTGVVRYVAPVADQKTRTFGVELEFANPQGTLPAGVSAEIDIPIGTVQAHHVATSLLTLDESGIVGVKLLDAAGRAQFVPAQVALATTDGAWVTGLPDPAPVITQGQGFVKSGQAVVARFVAPGKESLASRAPPGAAIRE
jgi:multidrug efflux system membrane fusion protein